MSWITPTNQVVSGIRRSGYCGMFQSLLSWITPTNPWATRPASRRSTCFNPCCPGSRPPTPWATRPASRRSTCFNPCCPGSRPPTRYLLSDRAVLDFFEVSILVVLDHAHQQRGQAPRPRRLGFNPCCPGSRPPTPATSGPSRHPPPFQSLLSWITPTNSPHDARNVPAATAAMFQSLLSWITPTNWSSDSRPTLDRIGQGVSILVVLDHAHQRTWRTLTDIRTEWRCFNPCCPGSRPPTLSFGAGAQLFVKFQSLLSVDHAHQRKSPAGRAARSSGFNPCCPGSRPPTRVRQVHHDRRGRVVEGFNPCCPGSRPPTTPSRCGDESASADTGFQSLLSWITPTNECVSAISTTQPGESGFNPCCPGSRPPTLTLDFSESLMSDRLVSILVVLDHAHQRGHAANRACTGVRSSRRFQSLLSWITPTNTP